MAQWDVFANPSPRMRQVLPYVVVLQSDLLSGLGTRLVAPLARQLPTQPGITARLSPALDVCGEGVTLVAQECARSTPGLCANRWLRCAGSRT